MAQGLELQDVWWGGEAQTGMCRGLFGNFKNMAANSLTLRSPFGGGSCDPSPCIPASLLGTQ